MPVIIPQSLERLATPLSDEEYSRAKNETTLAEQLMAAFARDNWLASGFRLLTEPQRAETVGEFDEEAWKEVLRSLTPEEINAHPEWRLFGSMEELEFARKKRERELEWARRLEGGPLPTWLASLLAGAADPTLLLPVPAAAAKTIPRLVGFTAAQIAATEAVRQVEQIELRPYESIAATLVGAGLTGGIAAVARGVWRGKQTSSTYDAAVKDAAILLRSIGRDAKAAGDVAEVGAPPPAAVPGVGSEVGAAPAGFTDPLSDPRLTMPVGAKWVQKWANWAGRHGLIGPGYSLAMSESPVLRSFVHKVVDSGVITEAHYQGLGFGPGLDTRIRLRQTLMDTNTQMLYEAGFKEWKQAGGKGSREDFYREVMKAHRAGDMHPDPVIDKLAKALRENVFRPILTEAQELGLLPKELVNELGERIDRDYFPALLDVDKVNRRAVEFTQRVREHFLKYIRYHNERVARLEQLDEAIKLQEEELELFKQQFFLQKKAAGEEPGKPSGGRIPDEELEAMRTEVRKSEAEIGKLLAEKEAKTQKLLDLDAAVEERRQKIISARKPYIEAGIEKFKQRKTEVGAKRQAELEEARGKLADAEKRQAELAKLLEERQKRLEAAEKELQEKTALLARVSLLASGKQRSLAAIKKALEAPEGALAKAKARLADIEAKLQEALAEQTAAQQNLRENVNAKGNKLKAAIGRANRADARVKSLTEQKLKAERAISEIQRKGRDAAVQEEQLGFIEEDIEQIKAERDKLRAEVTELRDPKVQNDLSAAEAAVRKAKQNVERVEKLIASEYADIDAQAAAKLKEDLEKLEKDAEVEAKASVEKTKGDLERRLKDIDVELDLLNKKVEKLEPVLEETLAQRRGEEIVKLDDLRKAVFEAKMQLRRAWFDLKTVEKAKEDFERIVPEEARTQNAIDNYDRRIDEASKAYIDAKIRHETLQKQMFEQFRLVRSLGGMSGDELATAQQRLIKMRQDLRMKQVERQRMLESFRDSPEEIDDEFADVWADEVFTNLNARSINNIGHYRVKSPYFAEREVNLPNDILDDFGVDDALSATISYINSTVSDLETQKMFGGLDIVNSKSAGDPIEQHMLWARNQAEKIADPKAREAFMNKAVNEARMLSELWNRVRGIGTSTGSASYAGLRRAGQFAMSLNFMRLMGSSVLSNLPDFARVVASRGLKPVFKPLVKGFLTGFRELRHARAEARRLGTAIETILNHRMMLTAGVGGPGGATRFERFVNQKMTSFAAKMFLIPQWTDFVKTLDTMATVDAILRAARDIKAGKLISPARKRELAMMGLSVGGGAEGRAGAVGLVSSSDLERLASYDNLITDTNGLLEIDIEQLRKLDPDLAFRLHAAVFQAVNDTVITPGAGDIPAWMDRNMTGRIISQFRRWLFASHGRIVMRLAQMGTDGRDYAAALTHLTLLVATGMASTALRDISADGEIDQKRSLTGWIYSGIDRGGVLGAFAELDAMLGMTFGHNIASLMTGEQLARYRDRSAIDQALGPTVGYIDQIGKAIRKMVDGEIRLSDFNSVRRTLPFQNWFGINYALNRILRSDSKERQNRARWLAVMEGSP